jgi:uncharacterized protein
MATLPGRTAYNPKEDRHNANPLPVGSGMRLPGWMAASATGSLPPTARMGKEDGHLGAFPGVYVLPGTESAAMAVLGDLFKVNSITAIAIGVGAILLAPVVGQVLRPVAKELIKGGMLVTLVCLSIGPALLGWATSANAQSWCRNATRPGEKLICKDAHLSGLDAELNGAFRRVHRELSGLAKSRLDREEFGWLLSRHRCGADYGCIERSYVERIEALNGSAARRAPKINKPAAEIPPPRIEQPRYGAGDRKPPLPRAGAENRGKATEGTSGVLNRPSADNPAWVNPEPGP